MSLSQTQTEHTAFHVHPGFYEIVNLDATRAGVDEWLGYVGQIWERHTVSRQPIPILSVQTADANIPLNYAYSQGLKLQRQFPNLPRGRTAFLIEKTFMIRMLDSFLRLMRLNIEFRYFEKHEREKAIAWLRELNADIG